MSFADVRKIAFDTETTGPDPLQDRIVTAALVAHGGGRPDKVMSWLINPGIPIPAEATEIHGIDDAKAATGAAPADALDDIADILAKALAYGMPVIAFNLSFDWTVLARDMERHRLPTLGERLPEGTIPPLLDPHVIDKQFDRYVKGQGQRKLKPTAERYGVELTDWHSAEADALAALLITEAQFAKFPLLGDHSPASLFTQQKRWRADQQAGLQQWFRTKATPEQGGDPNKVIDGSWPLIPIPHQQDGEA
ncbi:exonuclease domain-containing protein [Streptomyces sp. A0592]|uniref:exonuclease domain-containing protein n=1 Tax=Streptomyces sp. A0592 TaxID=2563099 RepID=UPI00109E4438|nr:exonuclease domain-containing protein [Streptomyces sp. A0592]THA82769.1 DNA polymerase III subunit epsilon [Streptomyces sp. A0592]